MLAKTLTNSHLDAIFLLTWLKAVLAFLTMHCDVVFKSPGFLGPYVVSSMH